MRAKGTFNIDTLEVPAAGKTIHYRIAVWVDGTLISAAKQCWLANSNGTITVRQVNDAANSGLTGMSFNIVQEAGRVVVKITDPSANPNAWVIKRIQ